MIFRCDTREFACACTLLTRRGAHNACVLFVSVDLDGALRTQRHWPGSPPVSDHFKSCDEQRALAQPAGYSRQRRVLCWVSDHPRQWARSFLCVRSYHCEETRSRLSVCPRRESCKGFRASPRPYGRQHAMRMHCSQVKQYKSTATVFENEYSSSSTVGLCCWCRMVEVDFLYFMNNKLIIAGQRATCCPSFSVIGETFASSCEMLDICVRYEYSNTRGPE